MTETTKRVSRGEGLGQALATSQELSTYFSDNARSFFFAGLLFPKTEREQVSHLYAYCRITDDLVDGVTDASDSVLSERIESWMQLTRQAYEGVPSGVPWLDRLMEWSLQAEVPFDLINELANGVRMDIGRVALQSMEELRMYCHRVASVVGIWLCHLWNARDPWVLERAAALGRAMQMTNILRDVGEDLRNGRCYLPAAMMEKHGLTQEDLRQLMQGASPQPAYLALINDLMQIAESEYERAWEGIAALPSKVRPAVAVAADVYRGIHDDLRQNGYDNFNYRAHTTRSKKIRLSVLARMKLRRAVKNGASRNGLV